MAVEASIRAEKRPCDMAALAAVASPRGLRCRAVAVPPALRVGVALRPATSAVAARREIAVKVALLVGPTPAAVVHPGIRAAPPTAVGHICGRRPPPSVGISASQVAFVASHPLQIEAPQPVARHAAAGPRPSQ